jgi:hypothetical protein
MENPSTKDIWMIDSTVCDILIQDTRMDQPHAQDQVEQGLGRFQLVCSIDPCSGLIVAFQLSYDETTSKP